MTEELKQKAEAEADKVIIGSGMDRASVIHLKHLLVTMYMQGATEATKELEAQIEKMKCCEICANSKDWRNRSLCIACEKSKTHINFVLRR
ncbi:MAG: hypothetical protein J6S67_14530 [Methanobrevibacter sp.]|nr:hypothetical protein [Methanobrevibacter sp.]